MTRLLLNKPHAASLKLLLAAVCFFLPTVVAQAQNEQIPSPVSNPTPTGGQIGAVQAPSAPRLDDAAYDNFRQTNGLSASGRPHYTNSMPFIALRTNLLYWGTLTPNLGVELGISPHSTLLLTGSINPWKAKNPDTDNKMLKHWLASLEYRYWFCERFNGHFIGLHGYGGHFNISGHKIPLVFEESNSNDYRYKGDVYGAGISYGYQFMLGKHWNLELNVGIGFGYMEYDRRDCPRCEYSNIHENQSRTFFAPTKLGISIVYIIK